MRRTLLPLSVASFIFGGFALGEYLRLLLFTRIGEFAPHGNQNGWNFMTTAWGAVIVSHGNRMLVELNLAYACVALSLPLIGYCLWWAIQSRQRHRRGFQVEVVKQ